MRAAIAIAAVLLAACSSPPPAPKVEQAAKADPVTEEWYGHTTEQLAALNREAANLFKRGKFDDAAAIVTNSQPLIARLLAAPSPTLAAMEAASDCDDLYGRMLLRNRHYGHARLTFQKNVMRWKNWKPRTADTARRLKQAEAAIAQCDKLLVEE